MLIQACMLYCEYCMVICNYLFILFIYNMCIYIYIYVIISYYYFILHSYLHLLIHSWWRNSSHFKDTRLKTHYVWSNFPTYPPPQKINIEPKISKMEVDGRWVSFSFWGDFQVPALSLWREYRSSLWRQLRTVNGLPCQGTWLCPTSLQQLPASPQRKTHSNQEKSATGRQGRWRHGWCEESIDSIRPWL